jgi:hypothetical protein
MKWMHVLWIVTSLLFLSGCSHRYVDDSAWVKPIYFSEETKQWLHGLEWPESAYEDFDKIGRHNEKVRRIYGDRLGN